MRALLHLLLFLALLPSLLALAPRLRAQAPGPVALVLDAEAVREEADLLLSLSPLTLQHELALLVLMEQLYRVLTLRAGHPYHRP